MKAIHTQALDHIERIVCAATGVTARQLCVGRGVESVSWARHAAMTLCREHTHFCTHEIARRFGRKQQSSCAHAVASIRILFEMPDSISRARAHAYVQLSAQVQRELEA